MIRQNLLKLRTSFGILGYIVLFSSPAAAKGLNSSQSSSKSDPLPLVPVYELSPVETGDWAFQQLERIAAQHSCQLADHQPILPRSVFAAQLQECLSQGTPNSDEETWATIQQLQRQYADELALLTDHLGNLEQRTATLEKQQFSTTTSLSGDVLVALGAAAGENRADGSDLRVDGNLFFGSRVELSFETSFTGDDELEVTLQARNIPVLEDATGTPMANLGFDGDKGLDRVDLDEVQYEIPLSDQFVATFSAIGGGLSSYVPDVNSLFDSSKSGAISDFGKQNPIVRQGSGTGFGLSYDLSDQINLSIGYAARKAAEPTVGLTGGRYGAIAQLTVRPTNTITAGFTYVRSFNNMDTGAGSLLAGDPFDDESDAVIANSYGAELSWDLSPTLTLGGRVGLIDAVATDLPGSPRAQIFTWAALLGITDLASEGDLLGFVFGQPPKVTYNDLGSGFEDPDDSLHFEAFYRLPLTENLAITPGFLVITDPNHNRRNDALAVGTLRVAVKF